MVYRCMFGDNKSTSTLDVDASLKNNEFSPTNNNLNSPLSPPPLPEKKTKNSAFILFRSGKPQYPSSFKHTISNESNQTTTSNVSVTTNASSLYTPTPNSPRYLPYAETITPFFDDEDPIDLNSIASASAKRPDSFGIPRLQPSSTIHTNNLSSNCSAIQNNLDCLDIDESSQDKKNICLDNENSFTSQGVLTSSEDPNAPGDDGKLSVLRTKTITSSSTTMQVS